MDQKIKGIVVEIGGNTTGLADALKDVGKDANNLQSELRKINSILKEAPNNEIIKTQKFDLLNKAVEGAAEKLNALWQAQDEVEKKFKNKEITADAYRDFNQELAKAQNGLKSAQDALDNFANEASESDKNTKNLKNEVTELGKSSDNTGNKMEKFGKVVTNIGSVVGKAAATIAKVTAVIVTTAAVAISGAIKQSIDAGIEFESAFAGVKKTVEATDEELATLKEGIRDLALAIPATTTEISAVAEAAGQMGIATKDILSFTRVMVDLGESTDMSATAAAEALAKIATITNMASEDYGKLGAVVVDLGNKFNTTESDIIAMTTRLAATGNLVGLSEPQLFAVANALGSVGIEAEAGGSAISKLLKQMETSVAMYEKATKAIESTGYSLRELELMSSNNSMDFKALADSVGLTSKELNNYIKQAKGLEAFAEVSGKSADEFIQAWGTDAIVALDSFIMGLNDTERLGQGAIEMLDEMGLKEVRLSNAILALSSSNGILTDSLNVAKNAWEEGTALVDEAAQRYETMESKIQVLKNGLTDLGLTMYESLEEPLKNAVGNATGYIQQLSTALKDGGLSGLADAAGQIIGDIITQITDGLPSLIETSVSILATIGSTITDNLPVVTEAALDIMMTLIDSLVDGLPNIIDTAIEIIGTLANGIMEKLPEITDSAVEIMSTIVTALINGLPDIINSALVIILSLVDGITKSLPELIPAAVAAILTIAENLIDNIDMILDCAIDLIMALADGIINALPILIEKAPVIIAKLVEGLIKAYPKVVKAGWDLLSKIVEGLLSALPNIFTFFNDMGKQIGETLRNIDWMQLGKDILNGIVKGLSNIGTAIADWGKNFVNGFKDVFGISSPSKVFEDELGDNMGLGVVRGFVKAIDRHKNEMYKAIPTDMGADINIAMRRVNNTSSVSREYQLIIPIDIGGNKFTKIVSKLQYDMNQGKLRVAGVSVR